MFRYDVNLKFVKMPWSVKATCIHNPDGSYTILVNDRLPKEQQEKAVLHEYQHIIRNDFWNEKTSSEMELSLRKILG